MALAAAWLQKRWSLALYIHSTPSEASATQPKSDEWRFSRASPKPPRPPSAPKQHGTLSPSQSERKLARSSARVGAARVQDCHEEMAQAKVTLLLITFSVRSRDATRSRPSEWQLQKGTFAATPRSGDRKCAGFWDSVRGKLPGENFRNLPLALFAAFVQFSRLVAKRARWSARAGRPVIQIARVAEAVPGREVFSVALSRLQKYLKISLAENV